MSLTTYRLALLVIFIIICAGGGGQRCIPIPTEPIDGVECNRAVGDGPWESWLCQEGYRCGEEYGECRLACESDLDCESGEVCDEYGACSQNFCAEGAQCNEGQVCFAGVCYEPDSGWCAGSDDNCNDGNPCTVDTCSPSGRCIFNVQVADGSVCGQNLPSGIDLVCFSGECVFPLGYCSLDAPMDMGERQCAATDGGFGWGTFCLPMGFDPEGSQKGGRFMTAACTDGRSRQS